MIQVAQWVGDGPYDMTVAIQGLCLEDGCSAWGTDCGWVERTAVSSNYLRIELLEFVFG